VITIQWRKGKTSVGRASMNVLSLYLHLTFHNHKTKADFRSLASLVVANNSLTNSPNDLSKRKLLGFLLIQRLPPLLSSSCTSAGEQGPWQLCWILSDFDTVQPHLSSNGPSTTTSTCFFVVKN
jgi:hypothetical protein